jgi:hypothetical protein
MRITWGDGSTRTFTGTGDGVGVGWTFQTHDDVPVGTATVYGECDNLYGPGGFSRHRRTVDYNNTFTVMPCPEPSGQMYC